MTDATWFFLTIGSAALAGGIIAGLVARYFDRHLRDREQAVADAEAALSTKEQEALTIADQLVGDREQAVTDAEDRLHRAALEAGRAADRLVSDIRFTDEWEQLLAAVETENADTVNMPKAGDG